MIIKRTYIQTDEISLPINEDGKNLRLITDDFLSGKVDDLDSLIYMVEQYDTHDVLYGIQFNLDDHNPNEVFRDVYISSNIIDYTSADNLFIEMEDEHMGNIEFANELFEQLERMPCVSLYSIINGCGFTHITRRGFDHTEFEAGIKLLNK